MLRILVLVSCGLAACKQEPGELVRPQTLTSALAPTDDPGEACADLGSNRVCHSELCPGGICVLPRPWLPGALARGAQYRCSGTGRDRICHPRAELASPFVCTRGRCVQRRPRLPDDNDWECADVGGMVLCRGGQTPAGVLRVQSERGWWCGRRRGKPAERLCLDLDPDRPDELGARAVCRFEMDGAYASRICETGSEKRVGDGCETESDCPSGARCVRGICVPPTFLPACWGDVDCKPEQCRLASCGENAR